jgi:hypothetical protein
MKTYQAAIIGLICIGVIVAFCFSMLQAQSDTPPRCVDISRANIDGSTPLHAVEERVVSGMNYTVYPMRCRGFVEGKFKEFEVEVWMISRLP